MAEACDMSAVPDATYDFVIASHVMEHLANPLRALLEWLPVLRVKGALLILVPDKGNAFDRNLPFRPCEHIQADFAADTQDDDSTHLDEVLSLHGLSLDPLAGPSQQFWGAVSAKRQLFGRYSITFSPQVLALMLERVDMRILSLTRKRPPHIIRICAED